MSFGITAEQHRQLGLALGYPACCIEQWVANPHNAGLARGSVVERERRPDEFAVLLPRVTEILGEAWEGAAGVGPAAWLTVALVDPFVKYVPCDSCAAERDDRAAA